MEPLRQLTELEDRLLKEMDAALSEKIRKNPMSPSAVHKLVQRNLELLMNIGYVSTPAGVFMKIEPDILHDDAMQSIVWAQRTRNELARIMEKKRAEDS